MNTEENSPQMEILHMWTGEDGKSTIQETVLTGFVRQSVGGKAGPQWMREFPGKVTSVKFAVLPVGWVGDWHESPLPQWVIPTKGKWYAETQDGNRLEMGPGDIHYGQDIGTIEINGNKGHKSGTVGEEPCFLILIQFESSPVEQTKEAFKK